MRIVRAPQYANAIIGSFWQRVQPQLEKLAPARCKGRPDLSEGLLSSHEIAELVDV
jgi:hypothetical protein